MGCNYLKLNFGEDGLIKILQRLEKIDKARQDRIEGKRGLFSQPPGLGRMAGDLVTLGAMGVDNYIIFLPIIKYSERG